MVKKNTRSTLAPWLLIGLGSLLILGVVIWKTVDVLEKTLATPTPEYSSSNTYLPFPDVDRISLEDAKTAYDAGTAVFIDVRDAEYFAPGHITGALNIPYSQVESQLDTLDPGQHIILYCTWLDEETSAGAAQILLQNGFTNVQALQGGLYAWLEAGYPVEP